MVAIFCLIAFIVTSIIVMGGRLAIDDNIEYWQKRQTMFDNDKFANEVNYEQEADGKNWFKM